MARSTEPLLAKLLDGIERELPRAVELRHRLHADPELAHAESRTGALLAQQLPVPCQAVAGTGLLARVGASGTPAAMVAAHVHPELPWGAVAIDPGPVNASCDAIEVLVEGAPSHGAYPHRGRDPILVLAQIVVALHAQVGRRIDPLHPATLTIGV